MTGAPSTNIPTSTTNTSDTSLSASASPAVEANRRLWDSWTKLHLSPAASRVYDLDAFKCGGSTLGPIETSELGPVAGKTLLHLQCHLGLDTLSLARLGAVATGVDFSSEAVSTAQRLSGELGLAARFVCSDIYALPEHPRLRGERFDVVFTSRGVLCWLPDLGRWASVVAHFLRPGRVFYVLETHPLGRLLNPRRADSAGNPIREGYFAKSSPTVAREHGSYANPAAEVWNTAYYFSHSLGDVVTALCAAGLRIEFLHEFPASAVPTALPPPAPATTPDEVEEVPNWFSIRAIKEERR